ncbi:TolC family protein [Chlorobium phaeovibrioides]|uniref:TolC family protein n=1 Tax=Chlorobium phaeovibrioides TaxID=1094 RepID=A0A3S0NYM7_CHLPH|nr:TolC family protein [Chlorobium phaeovibrioides]MWV54888.1 TolC family protein [Chlorobium phaeovibrioides]RTY36317.1 TolC family protein [Chlorobium phaeovibrioides]
MNNRNSVKWSVFSGNGASFFFLLFVPAFLAASGVSAAEAPLRAPSVERLTLEGALRDALENNTDIRVARGEEEIARNGVHIGNAGLLPKVSAVSSVSWKEPGEGAVSELESTTTVAELQASYTLFDGFGNIRTFTRLKNSGRLGALLARERIETVVMEVVRAYFAAANSLDQLDASKQAVDISEERLQRARLRAEYGQANTQELLSAEVDANNDHVALLNARLGRESAMRSLNVLLGQPVGRQYALADSVVFSALPPLDSLRLGAFEANAGYLASGREVRDSRLAMLISRSDHYPEVSLQAAWGLNRYAGGRDAGLDETTPGTSAAVVMSWDIFNGRQSAIKTENARIAWLNSRLLHDRAARKLEQELRDGWESWLNSREVLGFEEKNIESARLNFSRTRELYVLGQVTGTTFREAQLNLIQAEKSRASARYDAKIRELDLLRLGGRLLTPFEEEEQ